MTIPEKGEKPSVKTFNVNSKVQDIPLVPVLGRCDGLTVLAFTHKTLTRNKKKTKVLFMV
jgi:hypothetical protein